MRAHPLLAGLLAPAAIAGALAFTAASPEPAQAKAPTLIHTYWTKSVQCVPSAGNTVRARVNLRMRVVNYDGVLKGDWADHMEAKARLEPETGAGFSYFRSWKSWKTPYLLQNRTSTYDMSIPTDNVSGNSGWKVHLKLIWHRPAPYSNIKKDVYLQFNSNCGRSTGQTLPAAPAIPLPNSGGGPITGRGGS